MIDAIKYNLRNLTNFSGRDARQTFWYYVLFIVVLNFVVGMAVSVPATIQAMSEGMSVARAGGGDPAEIEATIMRQMSGMADTLIWVSIISAIVNIGLIGAALVRRMHDAGHSGFWAILAVIAQVFSIVVAYNQLGVMDGLMAQMTEASSIEEISAMQGDYALQGLVGYLPMLIVIVFGVFKSEDGPNQYGDEPVRF